jgi:hypothetical protein
MTIILNKEAKHNIDIVIKKVAIPYETSDGTQGIAWFYMNTHVMKEGSCLKLNLIVEVKDGELCIA